MTNPNPNPNEIDLATVRKLAEDIRHRALQQDTTTVYALAYEVERLRKIEAAASVLAACPVCRSLLSIPVGTGQPDHLLALDVALASPGRRGGRMSFRSRCDQEASRRDES